ncbi:MAG: glycosyltransferase family 2 protein [Butyrivibrio sp.]|nr:glycosyltransferase family 2 protein [Butyrivibrio sp.]
MEFFVMVCIILINYNGKVDTEECIKSIKKNQTDYKIIIVDNNSSNGKVEYNDVIDKKSCEIVYLDENIGFAAGNNIGIECAQKYNPDYLLLLNNDTVVEADFLNSIVAKSKEYNDNAVITTKIVYYDDNEYLWYGGCKFDGSTGEYKILGIGEKDSDFYNVEKYVEYITGCVMLFPCKVLDIIGKMSEDYFLYYEDADYCERIRRANVKMVYVPEITVYHKESRSTKKGSDIYQYYILRNYLMFIQRYSSDKTKYIIKKFFKSLKEVVRARMNYTVWKKAWGDFVRGNIGKAFL